MNNITTVNFHLIKACNFKCKFCYATFNDIHTRGLTKDEQFELLKLLAESQRFRKINFAGGEPTLVPYIGELIIWAKELGLETSIVTNASRIDFAWVENISPYLDILTLSVDSIKDDTNIASGRNQNNETISTAHLVKIANTCHAFGVSLKINTVISKFNESEYLVPFINMVRPFRWKILQVTRVESQNEFEFDRVKISSETFLRYINRNTIDLSPEITVIAESEEIIHGSYLMIDQLGRFYESIEEKHNYSDFILDVGVQLALQQVFPSTEKFQKRGGNYTTLSN